MTATTTIDLRRLACVADILADLAFTGLAVSP